MCSAVVKITFCLEMLAPTSAVSGPPGCSCACPFSFLYTFPLSDSPVFCRVLFSWFSGVFFRACICVFFSCLGWHPGQTAIIFCILARAFSGVFSGRHY